MPEAWSIIAAMLDLQNLRELGKEGREGAGERGEKILPFPPPFLFFQPNAHPHSGSFYSPNLPLLLKSKMLAKAFARPKKYACIAGYTVHW